MVRFRHNCVSNIHAWMRTEAYRHIPTRSLVWKRSNQIYHMKYMAKIGRYNILWRCLLRLKVRKPIKKNNRPNFKNANAPVPANHLLFFAICKKSPGWWRKFTTNLVTIQYRQPDLQAAKYPVKFLESAGFENQAIILMSYTAISFERSCHS